MTVKMMYQVVALWDEEIVEERMAASYSPNTEIPFVIPAYFFLFFYKRMCHEMYASGKRFGKIVEFYVKS